MNVNIEFNYRGMVRLLTVVVSVIMVLYHMWAIGFGSPEAIWFRGTHLLFAMVLTFLIFRVTGQGEGAPSVADYVLLVLGVVPILYLFINYDYIVNRIFYVDDLTVMDKIMGVMMTLVLLEAVRRVLGWAMPITAFAFLFYGLFIARLEPQRLLDQLY
ncbi:MAG: TRAP transporter permease, partial [Terriglobia bacterium]